MPDCGAHVCVHWVSSTSDAPAGTDATPANGIPDWVDTTLATVEHVWSVEVTSMGYQAPLDDSSSTNNGGNGKLDVYISNLGSQQLYGYCTTDDPDLVNPALNYQFSDGSAYCVVDNNYTETIFDNHSPLQNLKVTAAHEFFHAVQAAYDFFDDTWMIEGTATWMEDQVYDNINDNRQYLIDSQLHQPGVPLDKGSQCCFQYGEWIWWRFLSESLGDPTIIRDIWERADGSGTTKGDMIAGPDNYSLQAVKNALAARGQSSRAPTATSRSATGSRQALLGGLVLPGRAQLPARSRSVRLPQHRPGGPDRQAQAPDQCVRHVGARRIRLHHGPRHGAGGRADDLAGAPRAADRDDQGRRRDDEAVLLNSAGAGQLRVAFGRVTIKFVVVVMSNASQRYVCFQDTALSCQGIPLDDGRSYAFRATIN